MITVRNDPIGRDLELALDAWLGPDARSDLLVEVARDVFTETEARNLAVLGQAVSFVTTVDGIVTAALDRVRPDGVITRSYDVMPILLMEIGDLLWRHSPVKTGRYQRSHRLMADSAEIAEVREGWSLPSLPAGIREFMFAPIVPYARPIEEGWSSQAPDGVYQVVATMAGASYSGFAKISFGYREIPGLEESRRERHARPGSPRDLRQPVIIIEPI